MIELLSPAGTYEKMQTAFHFGADAVYFAGKSFGLRAFAGNFSNEEIKKATEHAHSIGKKVYVTLNIIAHDNDFEQMKEYVKFLEKTKVDAVIVADIGVVEFVKSVAPKLAIHISTQANIINSFSAKHMARMGVKRIVLARELSLEEIRLIRKKLPKKVELEAFVHGAMCVSYSGRCLLSNYLVGRDSDHGECVQPCRWEYTISRKDREDKRGFGIEEDEKGTYILNSKDMNMIEHTKELIEAGVSSFKIEGRMKTAYYVANVTNAYRRAIDEAMSGKKKTSKELQTELVKSSHRAYTTGFYFGETEKENLKSSGTQQTYDVVAVVLENAKAGEVFVEHRGKFAVGEILEVLSPDENWNKKFEVTEIKTEKGEQLKEAKVVQQKLFLKTKLSLKAGDMLRKELKKLKNKR